MTVADEYVNNLHVCSAHGVCMQPDLLKYSMSSFDVSFDVLLQYCTKRMTRRGNMKGCKLGPDGKLENLERRHGSRRRKCNQ
jgi:hypothetical protein